MAEPLVAVLDAGTTNFKLAVFNRALQLIAQTTQPLPKSQPHPGWVEQDPAVMASLARQLLGEALQAHPDIAALGLANQRETVVAWDKASGAALYPAIVWEDRRTQDTVMQITSDRELTHYIRQTTGLIPSSYFSATKIAWLLQQLDVTPNMCFGTIDSWLLFQLTGEFLTDYTNASRTMLFDIHKLNWDQRLLDYFHVPLASLPLVVPSAADFGTVRDTALPVRGVIGDQQASLYAAGNQPGVVKVTYGTGIFPMKLLGNDFILKPDFLTTLAVSQPHQPQYALETKIDHASARTSPVLDQPTELDRVVRELAAQTAQPLAQLLDTDTATVTVDGGISQNDTLLAEQARLNHVQMRRLSTYEGTAYGVAKLVCEELS